MIKFVYLTVLYIAAILCAILSNFFPLAFPAGLVLLAVWAHGAWQFNHRQDTTAKDDDMAFTLTFEMLELAQRISNGEVELIRDLWALVFPDVPFDAKRPADEISKDLADKFEEYTESKAAEERAAKESSEPVSADEVAAAFLDELLSLAETLGVPRTRLR